MPISLSRRFPSPDSISRLNVCFLLSVMIVSYSSLTRAEWHEYQWPIMGTDVSLTLWSVDSAFADRMAEQVRRDMEGVDARLSPYKANSDLALLNLHASEKIQNVSEEMNLLINRSLYYSHKTQGAFDITYASLGWYYDYREGKQPTQAQKTQLLPAVNYKLLKFDYEKGQLSFGHPDLRIDLGGIAKGYAVDRAAEFLAANGVRHATVSAGGDSRIVGDKRGQPWLIGIKNPRTDSQQKDIVLTLPLIDVAVSTSGDYERYFIDDKTGQRVHHIINPKTGQSAQGILSVTVIGPKGLDTDPLSTSVFVLGVEQGMALIEKLDNFDCVIIDASGQVHYSSGLVAPD